MCPTGSTIKGFGAGMGSIIRIAVFLAGKENQIMRDLSCGCKGEKRHRGSQKVRL
ncbi:hypothetical protein BDV38DRAFT_249039 [Aspergillus pseudotamarii]|uniref:Uncharacterized protein n=1 Tax=Aspergillus pseudotamarii TaxID=132259 RepID=A0A5N6SSK1_ASPPS|nr:uncharacterized protein BDV38DRAFT_249039 [Aspergillus pseudotamarii]KAE8136740.1 hypothetical protein BDV38DRAFT_249039 [Aspergillus pseudotamarii]